MGFYFCYGFRDILLYGSNTLTYCGFRHFCVTIFCLKSCNKGLGQRHDFGLICNINNKIYGSIRIIHFMFTQKIRSTVNEVFKWVDKRCVNINNKRYNNVTVTTMFTVLNIPFRLYLSNVHLRIYFKSFICILRILIYFWWTANMNQ